MGFAERNRERDAAGSTDDLKWWQTVTAYQIYPRSFQDSNGDGIGDIPGIISRLDHIADLGVGMIWLSPVYRSPMRDNGYDISDYRDIAPEYGTLDDMDRLIAAADKRGIRIVMDLVVNHTSDRHIWFEEARRAASDPRRDCYVWRDPAPDGGPPNDLQSYFGGPAWTLCPKTGQYYLHLFAPEQPDLNWQNPELRADIYDMMRWWVDRGIGGFRMDVIDLIGKDVDQGLIAEGPHLWRYLDEMHRNVVAGTDLVTIGESWHASLGSGPRYVWPTGPLSMIFQFSHIVAGWGNQTDKWASGKFCPVSFKRALYDWQSLFSRSGWNANFLGNHDLPRMVSAYGDGSAAAAKALAVLLLTLRGTPFIFQGDEIGMRNAGFRAASEYRDIETLNMLGAARDPASGLAAAGRMSRDNARSPLRWTASGGFSEVRPWIGYGTGTESVEVQSDDENSVLAAYRDLIRLRSRHEALLSGHFIPLAEDHQTILAYRRVSNSEDLKIVVNLSDETMPVPIDAALSGNILFNTHPVGSLEFMDAYQAVIVTDG
ncbi:MAG: alpha-glucosidase [Pseudomonadota bacterium]